MNILLTSAGQRVSLVRAFKKELANFFPKGKVFTVDANPYLSPACNVSDGFKSVKRVDDIDYIADLLLICKEWDIKVVVPTIDTELLVLSKNQQLFKENGINLVVSGENFVATCRDKRLINNFFKERGIDIPTPIDKNNPVFPLFIKPYDGSLSKDIFLAKSIDELTDKHLSNEKLMFMEYIDPVEYDEYTVDAYFDKNSDLKCAVPRKRISVRSGEISKGVTSKNFLVDFLKDKLGKLEGAVGCLTIQLFYNEKTNRVIAIEINARFGGGYPLSYLAGANFPLFLIQEYMLDEKISYFNDWEDRLLMLRYDDEILLHNFIQ